LFLKIIGSAPEGDLPPALDWELVNGIPWAEAFSRARTFLDRVKSATGRTPIIYTSSDFFGATPPSDFADYPLWVANYGLSGLEGPTCPTVPSPWNHWTIYQWTSSGGALDRDRF